MPTTKLRFVMPASSAVAFEAFHNHRVRLKWDTLLRAASIEGGSSHPFVGAISLNEGKGWKRALNMRTRFVSYDPPHVAAAVLVEPMGIFESWGASMHHRDIGNAQSELRYTFSIRLRPRWLGWLLDPLARWVFAWETKRRFSAMARFLASRS